MKKNILITVIVIVVILVILLAAVLIIHNRNAEINQQNPQTNSGALTSQVSSSDVNSISNSINATDDSQFSDSALNDLG